MTKRATPPWAKRSRNWTGSTSSRERHYENYAQCDRPFVADDLLYFTSYDESGNNIIVATDLADGDTDIYYPADLGLDAYLEEICAYKDGLLLALSVEYTQNGNIANLYVTDLEAEEAELLAEVPLTGQGYPDGLVYRADNDTLYFAMNGELWALPGMDAEQLESVASLPVEASYDVRPILTSEGYYITGNYEAVVRRNTDPALRSDVRLTVQRNYNPSINNAYYAFSAEYGDVDVVMVEQVEDVVQAMMNRSSDVDIYCLSVDSAEYEAVYSRGYMAELTESEETVRFHRQPLSLRARGLREGWRTSGRARGVLRQQHGLRPRGLCPPWPHRGRRAHHLAGVL